MSSGASRSPDQVPPYLRPVVVLAVAIAALASAIGMLLKGGVFTKLTPFLVIASLIFGGLSRTWSPTRHRVTLVAVVLLAVALVAAVFGSLR